MRRWIVLLSLLLLALPAAARAGTARGRSYSSRSYKSYRPKTHRPRSSARCIGCARDSHGRIKRNSGARSAFRRAHPCPATGKTSGPCPGYVIDHVQPLKRGGADAPSNMQWQTKAAAKAKDRVE